MIMLKSCKTKAAKEKLYGAEKTVIIRDVMLIIWLSHI